MFEQGAAHTPWPLASARHGPGLHARCIRCTASSTTLAARRALQQSSKPQQRPFPAVPSPGWAGGAESLLAGPPAWPPASSRLRHRWLRPRRPGAPPGLPQIPSPAPSPPVGQPAHPCGPRARLLHTHREVRCDADQVAAVSSCTTPGHCLCMHLAPIQQQKTEAGFLSRQGLHRILAVDFSGTCGQMRARTVRPERPSVTWHAITKPLCQALTGLAAAEVAARGSPNTSPGVSRHTPESLIQVFAIRHHSVRREQALQQQQQLREQGATPEKKACTALSRLQSHA